MGWLAHLVTSRPRALLVAAVGVVAAAASYGYDAPTELSPAGYEVSGSESTRAAELLGSQFDTGPANVVLLATVAAEVGDGGGPGSVDDPDVVADGLALADRLATIPDVADVTSYWSTAAPQLRSGDGRQALITARIVADEDVVYDRAEQIRAELSGPFGVLEVGAGGSGPMNLDVVDESERDLLRAELIAIPITTIIMLIVFRSVVAALLPLIVSAIAVTGTAATLKGLSELTLVSIFALNLTTALGLGMAVDYSLFLLSRWREERAAGRDPTDAVDAVDAALRVAGRPILFSGLTTAATLAALLLFDYPLLRSLAVAGFVVVALATTGALVALPAAMTLLGTRVDAWRVRPTEPKAVTDGWWYRAAQRVMARPVTVIVVTVAGLCLLGAPFLRAQFGLPDDRVLPPTSEARQVAEDLRAGFDGREFGALAAVAPAWDDPAAAESYAMMLSRLDGVGRVESAAGVHVDGELVAPSPAPDRFVADGGRWFSIVPDVEPISPVAEDLVREIRAVAAPAGILVGGESARLVDNKAEIAETLPLVVVWIIVAISVLLFRSFRSVVLPIKAFVLNLLSLTASFGAIVWIFQDGRLSGVLGYTPTGLTDAQTPVLIFCIAFGLSMDYEVFLLSRIAEEWRASGDTRHSVAVGLQRTGGIISAAAVLMAVVFLSFASGNVTFIQMVGLGLALSILMDAAVVRTLLVPAFMVVAGRWNWWSPGVGRVADTGVSGGEQLSVRPERGPAIGG